MTPENVVRWFAEWPTMRAYILYLVPNYDAQEFDVVGRSLTDLSSRAGLVVPERPLPNIPSKVDTAGLLMRRDGVLHWLSQWPDIHRSMHIRFREDRDLAKALVRLLRVIEDSLSNQIEMRLATAAYAEAILDEQKANEELKQACADLDEARKALEKHRNENPPTPPTA
jgi:hypothetical protein